MPNIKVVFTTISGEHVEVLSLPKNFQILNNTSAPMHLDLENIIKKKLTKLNTRLYATAKLNQFFVINQIYLL